LFLSTSFGAFAAFRFAFLSILLHFLTASLACDATGRRDWSLTVRARFVLRVAFALL